MRVGSKGWEAVVSVSLLDSPDNSVNWCETVVSRDRAQISCHAAWLKLEEANVSSLKLITVNRAR